MTMTRRVQLSGRGEGESHALGIRYLPGCAVSLPPCILSYRVTCPGWFAASLSCVASTACKALLLELRRPALLDRNVLIANSVCVCCIGIDIDGGARGWRAKRFNLKFDTPVCRKLDISKFRYPIYREFDASMCGTFD